MITLSIYVVLIVIAILLAVYSLWDYRNRIYGNIIAAFISSLLFFLTGVMGIIGEVVDVQVVQNGTSESVSINATTNLSISSIHYTYSEVVTPLYYIPVGWLLIGFGVLMLAVTVLFIIEIVANMIPGER